MLKPGTQLDVSDLVSFLAWLEEARRSDENGGPLAVPPSFRDQTVADWAKRIVDRANRAAHIEAGLRRAEASIDQQAAQVRDQVVQLAEHLAAVYECCDRAEDARAVRLRAAGFSLHAPRPSELTPPDPPSAQSP